MNEPPPETTPYEIQSYVRVLTAVDIAERAHSLSQITPEAFQARMRAVLRKGSRYCRPTFDHIWVGISFLYVLFCSAQLHAVLNDCCSAGLVVPVVVYFVALNALPKGQENNVDDFWPYGWDDDGRYWKARMIAVASFVGVLLLSWLPMLAWKLYVRTCRSRLHGRSD